MNKSWSWARSSSTQAGKQDTLRMTPWCEERTSVYAEGIEEGLFHLGFEGWLFLQMDIPSKASPLTFWKFHMYICEVKESQNTKS